MRRALFILACAAAACAVIAAYSNHFDNAFHFDDKHVIVNNLAIRSLHDVSSFFTDANTFTARPQNASYRPLLTLSFALDHALAGGLHVRQFHRTQFALLLLCGALLTYVFRKLFDLGRASGWNTYAALFAATLFCIHTANTETVNYISSRSSLVATLAIAGSFAMYLGWPRGRRYYLYLLPMIVGGLAKPLTVMFAPLLFLFVLFFEENCSVVQALVQRRKPWRALGNTLPAFATGGLLYALLARMSSEALEYATLDRWTYLISQPYAWLHYFRLFVFPRGLTADTDWEFLETWKDPRLLSGALFIAALVAAGAWLSTRPVLRPAAFGVAWFATSLLPTSSIVPLSEVYNEHRVFLPFVGLALALTWIAVQLLQGLERPGRPFLAAGLALALGSGVIVAHGVGTHERNKVWLSPETLWKDVTLKSPNNGRGLMNYGLVLMGRGDLEQALDHFERARVLTPNYSVLEVNLGIVHSALGRDAESEPHFRRALQLTPDYAQGHYYYARWLKDQARGPEALAQVIAALQVSPRDLRANVLALRLYAATGDETALVAQASNTLAFAPSHPLALAYSRGGSPFEVEEPSVEAFEELGLVHTNRKDWLDAASVYAHAIDLGSTSAVAWNNLGWARASLGFYELAFPCFRKALELDPTMQVAGNNLAWAERQANAQGPS